jgi:molecular chaperone IbpA
MTRMDFSPLFRSTVGFDRLFRLLDSAAELNDGAAGYPPYNIEKLDADKYRVTLAVAGMGPEDLEIEARENVLTVTGKTGEEGDKDRQPSYLYRGIAGRAFKRTFHLADHVKVEGAHLENGLLEIELVRELPEEMRPRRIEIAAGGPSKLAGKFKKTVEKISHAA